MGDPRSLDASNRPPFGHWCLAWYRTGAPRPRCLQIPFRFDAYNQLHNWAGNRALTRHSASALYTWKLPSSHIPLTVVSNPMSLSI
eukprot:7378704-Prymnesium_polylepis.2